jgi:excisionase family DNA binding protein
MTLTGLTQSSLHKLLNTTNGEVENALVLGRRLINQEPDCLPIQTEQGASEGRQCMNTQEFSIEQVAAITGLAVTTIRKWIKRKVLPANRTRGYVITAEDLRVFLLKQPTICKAGRKRKSAE